MKVPDSFVVCLVSSTEIIRMFKKLFVVFACVISLPVAGVVYYLVTDRVAYAKAEITSALLRDKIYDPAAHFEFDRACVFPPEAGRDHALMSTQGYREMNNVFPDTYTHWTLVLADDQHQTVRTLYIQDPKVKFGGEVICGRHIIVHTKETNGLVTAYVTLTSRKGAL